MNYASGIMLMPDTDLLLFLYGFTRTPDVGVIRTELEINEQQFTNTNSNKMIIL